MRYADCVSRKMRRRVARGRTVRGNHRRFKDGSGYAPQWAESRTCELTKRTLNHLTFSAFFLLLGVQRTRDDARKLPPNLTVLSLIAQQPRRPNNLPQQAQRQSLRCPSAGRPVSRGERTTEPLILSLHATTASCRGRHKIMGSALFNRTSRWTSCIPERWLRAGRSSASSLPSRIVDGTLLRHELRGGG